MKTKIIVICGPTACGKSRLAAEVAAKFGGEVINADSMQVYRGMDIAVAMPCESVQKDVPHHLFAIIEPEQAFSVAQWLVLARRKISEVAERSRLPVIVGGTGLYISSLVDNIIFDEIKEDCVFRGKMYRLAEEHGNGYLLEKLRMVDPDAACELHENNLKRVVRALESFELSGVKSARRLQQSRAEPSPYDVCMLGIDFKDRQILYDRINKRVDEMVCMGLVEEARLRFGVNAPTASQAIGHKELIPYFIGEATLESCIETLKMKTRNYAKRQLTWFRKCEQIHWAFMNEDIENVHDLVKFVGKKN
jgi:tRNA dimethylallyltransferase